VRCLVIYDITEDRARLRVAEICLDYGLSRVQYSAFLGLLTRAQQVELMRRVRRELGKTEARVALLPVCDADFRARQELTTP
jgi:CRISPR-associated protein Cas2